ncbi:MAG: EscU/YscU/HrcU family type III secretion system export apparatus switch protein [Myxococcales bacterium]|nr:EscU/YscU/HrcU family type III secretion system export apparatus switch protein [Myxococcales bacterium]USN51549.1 MAG: EscU/YscU/HrcU family type III secretion system export apparatus switch protein [Myxococcales bacterium]
MAQGEEKTEQPSELKLRNARKKGQVAKSADVAAFFSFACALIALLLSGLWIIKKLITFIVAVYTESFIRPYSIQQTLGEAFDIWLLISLPVLWAAGLGGVIGNVCQFGFLVSSHPIKPDIKKISPLKGIKKIFSKDRLFELIKQLVKFIIIAVVIIYSVKEFIFSLSILHRVEIKEAIKLSTEITKTIFFKVLLCFLVIALVDWVWQKFSFIKSMKMSKYEVKKEYKQQEGDPHLKHERKRIHQEYIESNSINNVSDASVVITNPSHLAIALRYRDNIDNVPIVIAKGFAKNAQHIISQARELNVPVLRNVSLARDLICLDIDEEIPEKLYEAVAEVLSFIVELDRQHEKGEL